MSAPPLSSHFWVLVVAFMGWWGWLSLLGRGHRTVWKGPVGSSAVRIPLGWQDGRVDKRCLTRAVRRDYHDPMATPRITLGPPLHLFPLSSQRSAGNAAVFWHARPPHDRRCVHQRQLQVRALVVQRYTAVERAARPVRSVCCRSCVTLVQEGGCETDGARASVRSDATATNLSACQSRVFRESAGSWTRSMASRCVGASEPPATWQPGTRVKPGQASAMWRRGPGVCARPTLRASARCYADLRCSCWTQI